MAYFYGLGRRKTSTARVRLQKGKTKGSIVINGKPAKDYLASNQSLLHELERPFMALQQENNFNIEIKVSGGGHAGQIGAIQLGIAKALVELNPDYRQTLKRADMLGRDPRAKERKKFGLRGARKKQQYTKR
jgi:small subunit ribosomal protein S9